MGYGLRATGYGQSQSYGKRSISSASTTLSMHARRDIQPSGRLPSPVARRPQRACA